MHSVKKLSILGCRGIPGNHGGFETFAERLSRYLVGRGWEVTVYCEDYTSKQVSEEYWHGIRLIHIPVPKSSASATILFDWKSTLHAAREGNLILTLGYNTALFCAWYRLKGLTNVINMDGLEWRRQKWSTPEKAWLYLNERFGCWFGNHLVADHPEIANHLATRVSRRKITMIPYGAERVGKADASLLAQYGLLPGNYSIIIARPEPENNILEIVSAFSAKRRGSKLVVLGNYRPNKNDYHKQVVAAASDEVVFPGGIYDPATVAAIRYYATLYVHGHSVGGTNPSLVEALGAGASVLAHDNHFNQWVAGPGAHYFSAAEDCAQEFDRLLGNADELRRMKIASIKRFNEGFAAEVECRTYEDLLERALAGDFSKTPKRPAPRVEYEKKPAQTSRNRFSEALPDAGSVMKR
jgi:glycosyltransferase involved in cell wall biosynthesis